MRMIFVNLPVRDLAATRAFWTALGFGFNEQYSDDSAACLVLEQNICAMLITHERFRDFITGEISDGFAATEVLNCLSCADQQEVDTLLGKALDSGAKPWKPLMQEHGMYAGSFQDLDGHVWELMAMTQDGAGS